MIIGLVRRALRHAEVPTGGVSEFMEEATIGNYEDLLKAVMHRVVDS